MQRGVVGEMYGGDWLEFEVAMLSYLQESGNFQLLECSEFPIRNRQLQWYYDLRDPNAHKSVIIMAGKKHTNVPHHASARGTR